MDYAPTVSKTTEQNAHSSALLYKLLYMHMYEYVSATEKNFTVFVSILIMIGIVDIVSILKTLFSIWLSGT